MLWGLSQFFIRLCQLASYLNRLCYENKPSPQPWESNFIFMLNSICIMCLVILCASWWRLMLKSLDGWTKGNPSSCHPDAACTLNASVFFCFVFSRQVGGLKIGAFSVFCLDSHLFTDRKSHLSRGRPQIKWLQQHQARMLDLYDVEEFGLAYKLSEDERAQDGQISNLEPFFYCMCCDVKYWQAIFFFFCFITSQNLARPEACLFEMMFVNGNLTALKHAYLKNKVKEMDALWNLSNLI